MGLVHPIHIIGTDPGTGRRRCLACIEIPRADPDRSTIAVISRILTLLQKNARYVALDLAHAENISDEEWERDPEEARWASEKEHRPLPARWRHVQTRLLNNKIRKLKKECVDAEAPQFPFIQTCLYMGASTTNWESGFMHQLCTRRWNAPPDWGGKYMWEPGCTIIDISDRLSYAMVLPSHMSCGLGKKALYRTLRLQPLDGHDWLRALGLASKGYPDGDRAWIEGEDEPAPVTSIDAIHEVWPKFPPPPPSVDSDDDDDEESDDSGADTDAIDHDDVAETKKKNRQVAEEKASALKIEAKREGSPEVPEPEAEQQTASTSRKRKRGAEPDEDEQRVWNLIQHLLVSYSPQTLGSLKRQHKNYRPLLKRFMDRHPEQFAPKHPGAAPLILAAFTYAKTSIRDLDLHQFRDLSGKQVVELVKGALAHNAAVYKIAPKDLQVLDISFDRLLRKDDMVAIVAETTLDELIIWHNPGLSREDVAQVSKGRIAKVTTRAGFLTPLKKFAEQDYRSKKSLRPYKPAPPILSPLPVRIRQVMWMMLGTTEVDPSAPQPDLAGQLSIPEGKLSLEAVDLDTLAVMLHPRCHSTIACRAAVPRRRLGSLAEFYKSIARFERFMSNESFIDGGYDCLSERWTLGFPLLMATGSEQSENIVTGPLPPEAFSLATRELKGGTISQMNSLPMRGPYPIVHGEYTLVFLREPDYGRLRVGMATLTEEGELIVLDPEAVALAAGDEKAALAWRRGVGNLPRWTGPTEDGEEEKKAVVAVEKSKKRRRRRMKVPDSLLDRYNCDTMALGVEALKKMLAAAAQLRAKKRVIQRKIWGVKEARGKKEKEEERERKAAEEEEREANQEAKEEAKEEVKPEEAEVKIEDGSQ